MFPPSCFPPFNILLPPAMTSTETFSLGSLATLRGLYFFGFSWLFGMSFWVTFFGGVIAFRALPRQQFGALQHRTFPVYFVLSILLSSGLLAFWTYSHPVVLDHYLNPKLAAVTQAWALATVLVAQSLNYLVVGPLTSKTMFKRQKLEKEEGKAYNDPGVSPAIKALNARFGMLHGISSLANLGAVIALGFHALWLGGHGI